MRLLLFLAVVVLFIAFVMPRLKAWSQPGVGRPSPRAELVKDPVCQTYIVMSRAIRTEVGGHPVHFCSRECAERYNREERRG